MARAPVAGKKTRFLPGIIGQDRALDLLSATVESGSMPSMLFAGPAGTGKRTVAFRLAQYLNCEADQGRPCGRCSACANVAVLSHPDHRLLFPIKRPKGMENADTIEKEIDLVTEETTSRYPDYVLAKAQQPPEPRQFILIAQVRWLRREMAKPPLVARRRFFFILHAHRMNPESANALLKILEEPQKQTTFVLTTESPNLLLDTIRSRCRMVKFASIPGNDIRDWLVKERDADPDDAQLAAQLADGSLGRALQFLEAPDCLLCPAAVDFFALPEASDRNVLEALSAVQNVEPATVVGSFLFLYRQALRARLGLVTPYAAKNPAVRRKGEQVSTDYLRRVVKFLSERYDDCRLSINKRLFLYTLLSSLRKARN